jgi:hypothetical protein
MSQENRSLNERVRVIQWRMVHEKLQFGNEFRIIPRWLIRQSVVLFAAGQIVAQIVHLDPRHSGAPRIAVMGLAAVASLVVIALLLLFGYINADAKRRGMNSTLWTLLAIFVPYLIGVVTYFVIREPLTYDCPQCGGTVSARFNFCPSCKYNLRPACPQCKHEVNASDKYCPHCAQELRAATA